MSDKKGVKPTRFLVLNGGTPREVDGSVVEEVQACLSVNGVQIAEFMISPNDLELFALGFLYNESIIGGMSDIDHIHVAQNHCIDVWLTQEFVPPERMIVTAGCGGGVTFDDLSQAHEPLVSGFRVSAESLADLMRSVHLGATLYQEARGIHTAALASETAVLLQVEDIGRHNTLDKLRGLALKEGVETSDKILLTSGRISSEMINKARRLGTPIVASRTSPTSLSVQLAEAWGITIVAYLRQSKMRIYTHPERVAIGVGVE